MKLKRLVQYGILKDNLSPRVGFKIRTHESRGDTGLVCQACHSRQGPVAEEPAKPNPQTIIADREAEADALRKMDYPKQAYDGHLAQES